MNEVFFPSNMFGNGLLAYAHCNDSKHIALSTSLAGSSLTGDVLELDSSISMLEGQMLTADIGMMSYDDGHYKLLGALGSKSFSLDFSNFGAVNAMHENS